MRVRTAVLSCLFVVTGLLAGCAPTDEEASSTQPATLDRSGGGFCQIDGSGHETGYCVTSGCYGTGSCGMTNHTSGCVVGRQAALSGVCSHLAYDAYPCTIGEPPPCSAD